MIIRKALDISKCNEITDFQKLYFSPVEGISAISIEDNETPPSIYSKLKLLKYYLDKFEPANKLNIMISVTKQPNSAMVRYKGGWGLLNDLGIDVELIKNKHEIVINNGDLTFILNGIVDVNNQTLFRQLLSMDRIVYFSIHQKQNLENIKSCSDWINNTLIYGGVVLFFLETVWEPANELVILKKIKA